MYSIPVRVDLAQGLSQPFLNSNLSGVILSGRCHSPGISRRCKKIRVRVGPFPALTTPILGSLSKQLAGAATKISGLRISPAPNHISSHLIASFT